MKRTKLLLVLIGSLFIANSLFAKANTNGISVAAEQDSIDLMAEFSLFYEDYKNKLYESALPHGWNVVNNDAERFIKYRPFRKMEDMLWYLHDSVATDPEEKERIADTTVYLYDRAMKFKEEKKAYYLVRKGYVLQQWKETDPDSIIKLYEMAIEENPELSTFYKDKLGLLYRKHATKENEYKLKALELYTKLEEQEPENQTWTKRIESLAESTEQLVDITRQSWYVDKDNTEKAWKYASLAIRASDYEAAVEPLKFLIDKNPKVINYWNELAKAYRKMGKTDKAIDAYKKLIELDSQNADHYVNIALIYKQMNQLAVVRSYLQKAENARPDWSYPKYIEAQLYETAASDCAGKFDFMDKCVYLLAVQTYQKAAGKEGQHAEMAKSRVAQLSGTVPTKSDYFFRNYKAGNKINIEGKCYGWINRSVTVPEDVKKDG